MAENIANNKRVAVTGGAGYIGSFTVRELIKQGYEVDVIDNLSTGHRAAVDPKAGFFQIDIYTEEKKLRELFLEKKYAGLIHFAAKSLVAESVFDPRKYYDNNVIGSLNLFKAAYDSGCKRVVFSSTAATYGNPVGELVEEHQNKPINPYGKTKLVIEYALADFSSADTVGSNLPARPFRAIALRYFNACGAELSAGLGEDHTPETHIIPNVIKAALKQAPAVKVFGTDYDTKDGTAVRDYIHVLDLADAHVKALEHLEITANPFEVFNVGTGSGNSIKDVIASVAKVTGAPVPHEMADRRPGDPPALVANSSKLQKTLNWQPKHSEIENVIRDAVQWHTARPSGYGPGPV